MNSKGLTLIELMIVILIGSLVFLAIGGWGLNLYKLTKCDFESPFKSEVIRSIGVVTPVGAVTGWIDIGGE